MKLTKSLRAVITLQFKQGDDMEYLAKIYGFTIERIENVIRTAMIEIDEQLRREAFPDGNEVINTVDQVIDVWKNSGEK